MSRAFSRLRATWAAIWVDGDLKKLERDAAEQIERPFAPEEDPPNLDKEKLQAVVELLREVTKTESEREANLNGRAAAVAGVAGLIVAASGAIGKSVFGETASGDDLRLETGVFIVGLVTVVAAMFMVVVVVLRPRQAPTRRIFVTDTLLGLGTTQGGLTILAAQTEQLNLLLVDRSLRTLAHWSVRNRQKARWLRRAWMFLALGVLLIGAAGVLVASTLPGYSPTWIIGSVVVGFFLVWLVLKLDLIRASRETLDFEDKEKERREELEAIAKTLVPSTEETTPPSE